MNPERAIELYEQAILPHHELPILIFENLTPENAAEFFAACPSEHLKRLEQNSSKAQEQEQRNRFRTGVRVFRNDRRYIST